MAPGLRNTLGDAYTVFEYLYRDAGNYKAWGAVLLRGAVTRADDETLRSCLIDGEFFVAEHVRLPALYHELWELSGGPTGDDHAFHEFHALREATAEDMATLTVWGDVADLVKMFRSLGRRWNCALSPNSSR